MRISNGKFLQVLTASPAAGVPIEVDVYLPDGKTMLDTLQNAYNVGFQDILNDAGSGSFTINVHDSKATKVNLAPDNIVKIKIGGIYRFAYVIEEPQGTFASQAGKHDEEWVIQGRGVLSLLDRNISFPMNWPTPVGPGDAVWNGTGGGLLHNALINGQLRGTLPQVTIDFTTTEDSQHNPWPDWISITYHVGTTLLDLMGQVTALGCCDVWMDVNLGLHALVVRSRDYSSLVVIRQGRHIADDKIVNQQHWSGVKSRILVEGAVPTGSTTATPQYEVVIGDESSIPGQREGFLSFTGTPDPTTLVMAGQAAQLGTIDDAKPIEVPVKRGLGPGDYEPYVDYDNGDYITLDVPGVFDLSKERIRSMSIKQRAAGTDYAVVLDLNSVQIEKLLRLAKKLTASTGGKGGLASGTAAAALTSAPPPSGTLPAGGLEGQTLKIVNGVPTWTT